MPISKTVPNQFPSVSLDYRLAIVGEAPGATEIALGRPFVGASGNLLDGALQAASIARSACFIGNVCQHQPPGNQIDHFDKDGEEIQEGLEKLHKDLNDFQPNCILLLGKTALWAAGVYHSISNYRGTIFSGFKDRYKCVASFHPAAILRQWDWAPLFQFDVQRAAEECRFKELKLPIRKLDVRLTPPEIIARLRSITPGTLCSIDIEGGIPKPNAPTLEYRHLNGVTCVSISTDPASAFIIPIETYDDETLSVVMPEFARFMANPKIPKVLQNSLYDYTCLAWHWKIPCAGIVHDTMLSGWEIYPELPKGLGTQASLWTREPYYKFERTSGSDLDEQAKRDLHYTYCCKDSAVTLEIHQAHIAAMTPGQREHYDFNMSLLPSLQFMTMRGILYDQSGNDNKLAETKALMSQYQMGAETFAGQEINLNSPKQMVQLLYHKLGLEPQYKKEAGKNTNKLTADADALLKLVVKDGQKAHPFLMQALQWKKLEGVRKQLELTTDKRDGRMRCSYNLVGTDTGRLSCQGSVTGSGTNLQTISKKNRKFFIPDPGYHFFQCDLNGADGWTVAAHAARLGDPTMLDDYLAGIKPAKVIALMHSLGSQVNAMSRPEIKALLKQTPIDKTIYEVCKVVQHGSSYGMQPAKMASNLLEKSFKRSDEGTLLAVKPAQCRAIQDLFFKRYPGVQQWQRWVERQINSTQQLGCANTHIRTFFGRPGDRETINVALAQEPQANTTYATNLAMRALWRDPENRRTDNTLIIEPLHSVHDALCGQFPIDRTEWAVERIRHYFNNTLTIAGMQIKIPFEGGYGPSWYDTDEDNRIGEI